MKHDFNAWNKVCVFVCSLCPGSDSGISCQYLPNSPEYNRQQLSSLLPSTTVRYPLASSHSAESSESSSDGARNVALLYLFGSGGGQAFGWHWMMNLGNKFKPWLAEFNQAQKAADFRFSLVANTLISRFPVIFENVTPSYFEGRCGGFNSAFSRIRVAGPVPFSHLLDGCCWCTGPSALAWHLCSRLWGLIGKGSPCRPNWELLRLNFRKTPQLLFSALLCFVVGS